MTALHINNYNKKGGKMNNNQEKLLTTKEIAELYSISISTLNSLRSRKNKECPPYLKINHSVRYRVRDFEEWLENMKQTSGEKGAYKNV
jgi:predicted DNA-binding transcriptional regulator AlpA